MHALPSKCKQVEIGLEFNLFLLEDGSVYFWGEITQDGRTVLNSYNDLVCLSEKMDERKFKRIECGYSHALLIDDQDKVFALGAGLFG